MIANAFRDPTDAAQRHFRSLLEAMSRPGRIVRLEAELPPAPAPLRPVTYALLLGLADHETPVWLDPLLGSEPVTRTLRFHCGCPLVQTPYRAAFAVATAAGLPPLASFAQGEPDYPDRSTTLLVEVAGLAAGHGAVLHGPGIDGSTRLHIAGVAPSLWAELRANHRSFPLGVDLILVGDGVIAALPRSTSVETP